MRFSTSGYVAQILAYEDDVLRLLQHLQLRVAARQANYAAVMLCRFSARVDGLSAYNNTHQGQGRDNPHRNLTLTLLHLDTQHGDSTGTRTALLRPSSHGPLYSSSSALVAVSEWI